MLKGWMSSALYCAQLRCPNPLAQTHPTQTLPNPPSSSQRARPRRNDSSCSTEASLVGSNLRPGATAWLSDDGITVGRVLAGQAHVFGGPVVQAKSIGVDLDVLGCGVATGAWLTPA